MHSLAPVMSLFVATIVTIQACKQRKITSGESDIAALRTAIDPEPELAWNQPLQADERRLTILATNDIHGGLEPSLSDDNQLVGGMALWAGAANAIREGIKSREKDAATVLLLDAGDQYQGTLPSNTNEGEALMSALQKIGYTAMVPGNHAYDFGPIIEGQGGWRIDRSPDLSRRLEVVRRAARIMGERYLSANTFELKNAEAKADAGGNTPCLATVYDPITKSSVTKPTLINLDIATHPDYIAPYKLVTGAGGIKIGIIGLDHPETPSSTTLENVEGLCFADEFLAFLHAYGALKQLEPALNVVLLTIHNGNAGDGDQPLVTLIQKIKAEEERINSTVPGTHLLDAVISGHTHYNDARFSAASALRVPMVQSGAGGRAFGRIDLIWNTRTKSLDTTKTKVAGGITLFPDRCDPILGKSFCSVIGNTVSYEQTPAGPDPVVQAIVQSARNNIIQYEPNANKVLGSVDTKIATSGYKDAPLTQAMTDALRKATGEWLKSQTAAPLRGKTLVAAFMNAAGLRTAIRPQSSLDNTFTYESLFNVIPFSNYAVYMELDRSALLEVLNQAIRNCGYGFLGQSGLEITFQRSCTSHAKIDLNAKLIRVVTTDGSLIFSADPKETLAPEPFGIATIDFLADGGDGQTAFTRGKNRTNIDIARDLIASYYLNHPEAGKLKGGIDRRWREL